MREQQRLDGPAIAKAARLIADLRLRRNGVKPPIASLPDGLRPQTIAEGYRIQTAARPMIAEALGGQAGWKVGATSPAMQARLGLFTPAAGALYHDRIYRSGVRLDRRDYCPLILECEIGVRLGRNLPGRRGGHLPESVAPAVAAIFASIEIVEQRFQPPLDAGMASHVADDFFSVGAILADERPLDALGDPVTVKGEITVNGKVAFAGHASDILGHPLSSLAWLADHCAEQGTALRAGEIVSLGSISPGIPIPDAGEARVRFDGIGEVIALID
jgi:2-keto-4-pentenoate hydratase